MKSGITKSKFVALLLIAIIAVAAFARPHKKKPKPHPEPGLGGEFYVLAMSWAPNYCDDPSKPHSSSECDPSRHLGFIVHGLWVQDAQGHPAADCTGGSPLGGGTVNQLLQYIPDRGLIAHEWQKHLSCHFTPDNVLQAFQQAVAAVRVPEAYKAPHSATHVPPSKLESDFASANSAQSADYKTSCHAGKLVNFEACLTTDFKAKSCGAMPDCPASSVTLDAVP